MFVTNIKNIYSIHVEVILMFYDRLKTLVIDSQKSFNQVERELRYPRNALANYRLGKEPSAKRLTEIADYFNVHN